MDKREAKRLAENAKRLRVKEHLNQAYRDSMMAYTLMNVVDLFLRRARGEIIRGKVDLNHRPKQRASRIASLMESVIKEFDLTATTIDKAIYEEQGWESYDSIRNDANEIARLIQLYYDRCADPETAGKINDFLNTLPSLKVFTEEELKSIKTT